MTGRRIKNAVVAGGGRGKDDRKQNAYAPKEAKFRGLLSLLNCTTDSFLNFASHRTSLHFLEEKKIYFCACKCTLAATICHRNQFTQADVCPVVPLLRGKGGNILVANERVDQG